MIDKNWEGSTEDFAKIVAELAEKKDLIDKDQFPNVRLVRDYVSRGILSKPRKEGKEVFFGYSQVIEFLACRSLIKDGWPLKKIAEDFQRSSFEEIRILIPGEVQENSSLKLIKSFNEKMPKRQKSRGIFGQLFNKSNVPNLEAPENSVSAPSDDVPAQPFRNREDFEYFNSLLLSQQGRILERRKRAIEEIRHLEKMIGSKNPKGESAASSYSLLKRTINATERSLAQIERAFGRIKDGSYGYCIKTGKPIPLEVLKRNPTETLSNEAKEARQPKMITQETPKTFSSQEYASVRKMVEARILKMEGSGRPLIEILNEISSREPFKSFRKEIIKDFMREKESSSARFKETMLERHELEEVSRQLKKEDTKYSIKNITNIEITETVNVQIETSDLQKINRERAKAIAKAIELNLIKAKLREDKKDD